MLRLSPLRLQSRQSRLAVASWMNGTVRHHLGAHVSRCSAGLPRAMILLREMIWHEKSISLPWISFHFYFIDAMPATSSSCLGCKLLYSKLFQKQKNTHTSRNDIFILQCTTEAFRGQRFDFGNVYQLELTSNSTSSAVFYLFSVGSRLSWSSL